VGAVLEFDEESVNFDPDTSDEFEIEECRNNIAMQLKHEFLERENDTLKAHNRLLSWTVSDLKNRMESCQYEDFSSDSTSDTETSVRNENLTRQVKTLKQEIKDLVLDRTEQRLRLQSQHATSMSRVVSLISQFVADDDSIQLEPIDHSFELRYRHMQALKFKMKFPTFAHFPKSDLVEATQNIDLLRLDHVDFYRYAMDRFQTQHCTGGGKIYKP